MEIPRLPGRPWWLLSCDSRAETQITQPWTWKSMQEADLLPEGSPPRSTALGRPAITSHSFPASHTNNRNGKTTAQNHIHCCSHQHSLSLETQSGNTFVARVCRKKNPPTQYRCTAKYELLPQLWSKLLKHHDAWKLFLLQRVAQSLISQHFCCVSYMNNGSIFFFFLFDSLMRSWLEEMKTIAAIAGTFLKLFLSVTNKLCST